MKRRIAIWVGVFLGCLALQGTVAARVAIAGVRPDLPFLALFVFALHYGTLPGIYVGFVIGLCQDLYAPAVLGQNALCKSVTGYFCGLFNERMMSTDPVVKMVILLLAFGLHDLVFWGVDVLKQGAPAVSVLVNLGIRTLPRAAYTMAFAALYYGWQRMRSPAVDA
jgi:rod shape-determining protein MreD